MTRDGGRDVIPSTAAVLCQMSAEEKNEGFFAFMW